VKNPQRKKGSDVDEYRHAFITNYFVIALFSHAILRTYEF